MNSRPNPIRNLIWIALLLGLAVAIVIAVQQSTARQDAEARQQAGESTASAQIAAALTEQTAAAAAMLAQSTQAAAEVDGVRSAAATLQAGSLGTREALNNQLATLEAQATQSAEQAAAADFTQTAQADVQATINAQATALADMNVTQAAALTVLEADAQQMADAAATQTTLLADAQAQIDRLTDQVAQLTSGQPTALPQPTVSADAQAEVSPRADVSVEALLLNEEFGPDTPYEPQSFANIGLTRIEDEQLIIEIPNNPQDLFSLTTPVESADVYMELDVYVDACPQNTLLFLDARADLTNNTRYLMGVDCSFTTWAIYGFDGSQPEILGVGSLNGDAPPAGSLRQLGAELRGGLLQLYVDGVAVGAVQDERYTSGAFGFSVLSSQPARIRIDNLRIWSVSAATTETPVTLSFDALATRDRVLNTLPDSFAVGDLSFDIVSSPQLDANDRAAASIAFLMSDGERSAFVLLLFTGDTSTLSGIIASAAQDLNIRPLEGAPEGFAENAVFGVGEQGLEALWIEDNLLVRLQLTDATEADLPLLFGLASAVRDEINALLAS